MAKGWLWLSIGLAMAAFDLAVRPIFNIPLGGGWSLPLAVLAAIYGGLLLLAARMTEAKAQLTEEELATFGDRLELATPRIIALSEQRLSTGDIAATVGRELKIPEDVLIKYMYAMRAYLAGAADAARAEQRRNRP